MITRPKPPPGVIDPRAGGLTYRYEVPFFADRIVELHTKRDPDVDPPPPDDGGPPPSEIICTEFWDSSVLTTQDGRPLGIPYFLYYVGNGLWINPPQCCPPTMLKSDGSPMNPDTVKGPEVNGSAAYIPGQNATQCKITFFGAAVEIRKWPRTCPLQTGRYDPEIVGSPVICEISEMFLDEHEAHQGCGTTIYATGGNVGWVTVQFNCDGGSF